MRITLVRLTCLALVATLAACTREPETPANAMLAAVPADTPYVFITSRQFPEGLRERLADQAAAQLAVQHGAFGQVREDMKASPDGAALAEELRALFDVIDALLAELAGRDTAHKLREIGIEPVTRSVFYGVGVLPAFRVELADGKHFDALLDRVEQRAGHTAERGTVDGLDYRRIDLGSISAVLAVDGQQFIGGLLPNSLLDKYLPMVLDRSRPDRSVADEGTIGRLVERHGFTGYGEGYVRLDTLVATALGKTDGLNAEIMTALNPSIVSVSRGCIQLAEHLVAKVPRMAVGVTRADDRRIVARGIWETDAGVTTHLQRLAAPVKGVGLPYEGLLSMGMGFDLPQVRNAIEALLDTIIDAGGNCEWVEPTQLKAVIPQLNLALGPMTAGLKGFNLQLDELRLDPATMQPVDMRAGLLAAVDDPRGVFALAAMFNPELASIRVPTDGTLVPIGKHLDVAPGTPSLQVAIQGKSLLVLAGNDAQTLAQPLLNAAPVDPPPLFVVDYGIRRLVEQLGGALDDAIAQLTLQGEQEVADEMRMQLDSFRQQAQLFERLRVSLFANDQGLVMEQDMLLR